MYLLHLFQWGGGRRDVVSEERLQFINQQIAKGNLKLREKHSPTESTLRMAALKEVNELVEEESVLLAR